MAQRVDTAMNRHALKFVVPIECSPLTFRMTPIYASCGDFSSISVGVDTVLQMGTRVKRVTTETCWRAGKFPHRGGIRYETRQEKDPRSAARGLVRLAVSR